MTIDLPQRPAGLREVPPPRTPQSDGANEFASFAAQLAARSEKRGAGIATAAAPLNIDREEAKSHSLSSLLGSRRAGPIGAAVLLLVTASLAGLAVWGLPFQPSGPSSHVEQAKAGAPPTGKLEAKIPPSVSAPPSAVPLGSPPPASPKMASPPPISPAATSAPAASPSAISPPPVAPAAAPKELARSTPLVLPPATQIPAAAQAASAALTPDEVRELQGKLKAAGFNPGAIDGVVGRQTRSALRDYAQARALPNADATKDLLVRLKAEPPATVPSAPASAPAVPPPAVAQQADKPTPDGAPVLTRDEIRNLQDRLQAAGYYLGTVDGVMGRQTRIAVRDYAEAQGIANEEATRSLLSR